MLVAAQSVDSFAPRSGPSTGQTLVTVTGKSFRNTNAIRLRFSTAAERAVRLKKKHERKKKKLIDIKKEILFLKQHLLKQFLFFFQLLV